MTRRQKRMLLLAVLAAGLAGATALMLSAFEENLLYFYDPTQVAAGEVPPGARFRVGGLVEAGSVQREAGSLRVRFVVADCANRLAVEYTGILPDLFREGQGIVVHGRLDGQGVFQADEVLAKHDENYMPPEVVASLNKSPGQPCMPVRMRKSP
ncbi:MAG TPA: cytochrome c maturation protein CcmE [Nevskiales bacterium]|nr:cytochrome c maturation protein CcmE [Nevskiales bacterium]